MTIENEHGSFANNVILEDLDDGNIWKLHSPLVFVYNADNNPVIIRVPKGFRTDLASVPWVFRWLFPKHGKYTRAAVLHDYLYSISYKKRKKCDKILEIAMLCLGCPKWKAKVFRLACNIGGKGGWK